MAVIRVNGGAMAVGALFRHDSFRSITELAIEMSELEATFATLSSKLVN